MRIALGYDVETTGLPDWKAPSESPQQPHLVQLAGLLVDLDTRRELSALDVIIRPDGWEIPEDMTAIHGVSTELALEVGVPEADAVRLFLEMWDNRLRIAHNQSFDARLIRIACMRYFPDHADKWKDGFSECTQILATPIVKAPPTEKMLAAGRNNHKSCNLAEAVQFFTGQPHQGAHSAMADTRGALTVYYACKDHAAAIGA